MNNRWLIIVNPSSGNGHIQKVWADIEKAFLQKNIVFSIRKTAKSREATQIVRQAIDTEGYRKIIGIGGDGTMNEIVNGIFQQTTVIPNEIAFTMLPIGTGNDWASSHNITPDLEAWIEMILRGRIIKQDIGIIEFFEQDIPQKHYFANAGGLAYDAQVVQSIESNKRYIFGKKISYFLHILKCLWDYKPEKVRVVIDDETIEDFFYTINLGINKTSGGGMKMAPQAINNDGLMALTLIRNLPKWKVIWYTTKLYNGTIGDVTRHVSLHQAEEIRVESLGKPIYCETDGELVGTTPIKINILKQALSVVC
jgi:YegS/Rv2252/BmrU family lipid kinase